MIWTYRVLQTENGEHHIREVFYERDGTILAYSKSPVVPKGASLADLTQEIKWLQEALTLPVLTVASLEAQVAAQPPKPHRESRPSISHEELVAKLGLSTAMPQKEPVSGNR